MIINKLGTIKPNVKLVQQARPVSMSPLEIPVETSPFLKLPSAETVISSKSRGYNKNGKNLESYEIIKKTKTETIADNFEKATEENKNAELDKGFFVDILA